MRRVSLFFMSGFILGIDLGTTNSLVGVVDSGFPILLADAAGERLTPSAVHVAADGTLTVGSAALRRRVLEPGRTITSVKRLIGHRAGEAGWEPPYDLKALGLTPVEVSACTIAIIPVSEHICNARSICPSSLYKRPGYAMNNLIDDTPSRSISERASTSD